MKRVGVFGLGVAGTAVARALAGRDISVVLADDATSPTHRALAAELGADLVEMSGAGATGEFLSGIDTLIPAPGVPPRHAVIVGAQHASIPVRTEIDVAYEWESSRPGGGRPLLGVTGTDGKTTTTMLTGALLRTSGLKALEVGNTDVPFMAALDESVDAFVVECSSFRLRYTTMFRCAASVWLNLAPDHLDWHVSLEDYAAAKANLWAHVRTDDVAVAPAGDTRIESYAKNSGARVVTFGGPEADYRCERDVLAGPHGVIAPVSCLRRAMPHDISNALAAVALVESSGLLDGGAPAVRTTLANFEPPHHRIEFVGEFAGSRWYDDSKATSPHAALTAIRAFDRIVLIAGGRNKDLDLSAMASEPSRMHAVVAIGDDAESIEAAFSGVCTVVRAASMAEAVARAAAMSSPGVDVLLSPGCTSYDWYNNYSERGSDFAEKVRAHFGMSATGGIHR